MQYVFSAVIAYSSLSFKEHIVFSFKNISGAFCRFFQYFITIFFSLTIFCKNILLILIFLLRDYCYIGHPWRLSLLIFSLRFFINSKIFKGYLIFSSYIYKLLESSRSQCYVFLNMQYLLLILLTLNKKMKQK